MPKKSVATRTAQRNRSKAQKGFELVRETSTEEQEATSTEPVLSATPAATPAPKVEKEPVATKGSASARLAARRQSAQKVRNAATLITAEHYAYVTRDLIVIAVLACIMLAAIIALYFVFGRIA